jgi:internalin A
MSKVTQPRSLKKIKAKPESIVHIERFYNIKLNENDKADVNKIDGDTLSKNTYKLDAENNVIGINLNDCNINDITPIYSLTKLVHLNLTSNLIRDVSGLQELTCLTDLYLGGNDIQNISGIEKCCNLTYFIIWNSKIKDFSPISKLLKLEKLYCQNTGLLDLSFIAPLINLDTLAISENMCDISTMPIMDNLCALTASIQNFNDLEHFLKFKSLTYLDVSDSNIKIVSKEIAKKFSWLDRAVGDERLFMSSIKSKRNTHPARIDLNNNPLSFPPVSVLELGEEAIVNYYDTTDKFGYAPLSEGRIIVVGDGSAGKSSLIERILHDSFEQGKNQTNGIKIDNWKLNHKDGRLLTFHIWDFGGQEIQHAVHKFFFTEGCLYVLVLDNRKEEEPEYWLQQIESLGRGAPVLVVFNKHDDNAIEIADKKFLKEKYPNIIGFYNTSCKTGYGIHDFKEDLQCEVIKLRTVDEQFPNNWFSIKKTIEKRTSGEKHYLSLDEFKNVCVENNVPSYATQKLLLKYFSTIGAITWFGDTYLSLLHVLSPAWITQGVYKIITSKKTAKLLGHINISDFSELLQPLNEYEYTYDDSHYGYILGMMRKFDLCYTADEENILLPSAFGKEPGVEYSDFKGHGVRTYVLSFKDYMPIALIHRFIAKKLSETFENNYWYSGIVIRDTKSKSLAMVQADREAKRIYIRIKGNSQLGVWEHVRREFSSIANSYASVNYTELILLDEKNNATVSYEDLISHIAAGKALYFHPKLQKDFNVGYLMGLFESKEHSISKFKEGNYQINSDAYSIRDRNLPGIAISILNNNSPTVNANFAVNINIELVNEIGSSVKGDAIFLLEQIGKSNKLLSDALEKIVLFAQDAKGAQNSGDVKEKGWTRKLKGTLETIGSASEQLKKMQDGGETMKAMIKGIHDLVSHFQMSDIADLCDKLQNLF